MKIKDIVNRDLINLTNCDQEPIHIPGSIQPHGFLIGLSREGLLIDYCSGNCVAFTGLKYEQLLGRPFAQIAGEAETVQLTAYLARLPNAAAAPLIIALAGRRFSCMVQTGTDIYLEFEPYVEEDLATGGIYHQARQFSIYMQQASSLQGLCQLVAEETRNITGFDRVMIYRFDENYNGEVIAESCVQGAEPFIGLHYPHTDIPAQARELFMKNQLRLIPTVNYEPVPLYTIDDRPGKTLDLGLSALRSVSPIHLEYLRNMGVAATLTISLLKENKLWGLIACHHLSPRYIAASVRIAAQLQGQFLSSQIGVRQLAEAYEVSKKTNRALDELLTKVFAADHLPLEQLVGLPALLQLTNAAGVVIAVDDELHVSGMVPPMTETRKLINWLNAYNSPMGFSSVEISALYPDGKKWCELVAGIVFHPLGNSNDCIIWMRPQVLQEVNWAGDPGKAVLKGPTGLSPRHSFALWQEIRKCESNAWLAPELAAAASFASALQKHLVMLFLTKEESRQRKLSQKLAEANAELEHLSWIGSHDLKEPLRKIQLFASRILDKKEEGLSESILHSVAKMNDSALRMQVLIADILSYSRLDSVEKKLEPVDLHELVKNLLNELGDEIQEKNAKVEFNDLPVVNGLPLLLQQLLVNLIRNALKFSKAAVPSHITITAEATEALLLQDGDAPRNYHRIIVRDNGIGFDNQFRESIFKVFTRLHNSSEYDGSGVGLALCKKIMQNHNGYISAAGVPGEGASFSLYFPV